jgi:hypothetical protein
MLCKTQKAKGTNPKNKQRFGALGPRLAERVVGCIFSERVSSERLREQVRVRDGSGRSTRGVCCSQPAPSVQERLPLVPVRGGIRFVPREFGPSVRNARWRSRHPDLTRPLDSFFSTGIVLRQGQCAPLIRQSETPSGQPPPPVLAHRSFIFFSSALIVPPLFGEASGLSPESLGLLYAMHDGSRATPTSQGLWIHSFLRELCYVRAGACL